MKALNMKSAVGILVAGVTLASSGSALAGEHIGITFSFGTPAPYVVSPPVVVAPVTGYYAAPAPVYYPPRVVYYEPARVHYRHHHHQWRHHHGDQGRWRHHGHRHGDGRHHGR